jgi:lipopolysaccharide/colanic/teichoic acid biosynthesis glycosyltransferase
MPLFAVIALAIYTTMGRPVFFKQIRPGLDGKPFVLYKFRTMSDKRDYMNGHLLSDSDRVTKVGRTLRSTSLDELPELFNTLKGEMSLVGPRPLLTEYISFYTEREQLRHSLRPGITGWAQINGRNRVSWDDRLALDVWYVENWSLLLDIKIVFKTIMVVLSRDGFEMDPRSKMFNLDEERSLAGHSSKLL